MDELIRAISLAPNEEARRAILRQQARTYPSLQEPPAFEEERTWRRPGLARSDYLLFTARFSALNCAGLLLLRYVYTGQFGFMPGREDLGFTMISMVDYLELAEACCHGAPPCWRQVSFGLLPTDVLNALDERIIEQERSKA